MVKRLCNMGASLSARDDQGLLPLHHAVRHKRLDVVLFLLGKIPRAGLAAVDTRKQQTALHKVHALPCCTSTSMNYFSKVE